MQVGFSAYIGNTRGLSNTKVVFENTHTNIGNAYDTKTGIFTAPVDGVYAFHWTIMIHKGRYSKIYIQVNDSNKAAMYAYASGYPNHYSPSQSYATDLKKGDRVNIYNSGSSGYATGTYSTFTGYKL
ncbi:hypothetical protein FSP39_018498 [Pinctada imbricata]|uniref:C1q domain-containing protein n=1 Tax=Pinctada imbricata TaxID=66713 RepID=A0AA88Y4I8_PINIB|nr:hypothetical protein FSP39_018498 [Pinctada imbricata]